MKEEFDVIREELEEITSSHLLFNFLNKIDGEIHFINSVKDMVEDHLTNLNLSKGNELKFYNEIKCYNTLFLDILNNRVEKNSSGNFEKELSELSEQYNDFFKLTDIKRIEFQDRERFKIIRDDSIKIKIGKVFKSAAYFFSTFYGRINNLIRKVFKLYEKPLRQWKRKVRFRNLLKLVIRNRLLLNYLEIIREMNRDLISALQTAWMAEEKINNHFKDGLYNTGIEMFFPGEKRLNEYDREINSALKTLQKTRDSLSQNFTLQLDIVINELDLLYKKAGTIEFLSRHYSNRIVESQYNELVIKYKNIFNGWNNTFYILFEGWKFNKDIYINEILNVQELYLLKEESRHKIIERIIPKLEEIEKKLAASKNRIENLNTNLNLKETLFNERSGLSESLCLNLIPVLTDRLLDEQIPESVNKLELNLKAIIEKTFTKRATVNTEIYTRELRDSEIEYIDPKELILTEIFPDFLKETNKLKSSLVEQIEQLQKEINVIYEIANFNLDSAAGLIESHKLNIPGNEPAAVAAEGLHRSISKVYEVKSKLLRIYDNILRLTSESIASLNDRIAELPRADNNAEIKSKPHNKVLEAQEQINEEPVSDLKNDIAGTKRLKTNPLRNFHRRFLSGFKRAQKNNSASGKASDFLNETGDAIQKLPYVYQRLFRIEPLDEEKFYEPRTNEMNLLDSAFESWRNGKNTPVVLVGERGSGITTIINLFLKSKRNFYDSLEIIKGKSDITITDEIELVKFLGNLIKMNTVDKSDIINFLNMPGQKIIVLEKLQHLFLRKIGGFNALRLLFEIISGTTRNVFWLLTSNIYAWNYIDRVLNASEYFGYVLKPDPFTDNQIIDIILRRHRVSGYNILFKPSSWDLQNNKFLKLNPAQKQAHLKEKYFSQLNKFAKSNLSISLLFWMRSTTDVKNDTITIGSLEELDFSFLQSLSDEKIFTLNSLIMHDGLTPENHSQIFNLETEKSRQTFHLLNDDGIIIKNNIGYIINPILYRHTVRLLQTKNILH